MMPALISLLFALPLAAAITDLRVAGSTPTRVVIAYTAPDASACSVEASKNANFTPLAHDVNPALFSGANLDTRVGSVNDGRSRIFVTGTRRVDTAANGKKYSRALQNETAYFIRVTCGADQASLKAGTAPPIVGLATREHFQVDSAGWPVYPDWSFTDRNEEIIEPQTGYAIKRWSLPADVRRIKAPVIFETCSLGTNWTNVAPCAALTGGQTSYSGISQDWLRLDVGSLDSGASSWFEDYESNAVHIDWFQFSASLVASGVDLSAPDRALEACISYDGAVCASVIQQLTAPTTEAVVSLCGSAGSATCTTGDLWGAPYRFNSYKEWGQGYLYNTGSSTTLSFTQSADCSTLRVGEVITLAGTGVAVQSLNCGGAPATMVVSSALDLNIAGFLGATGYPFQYITGFAFNPRLSVLVRKKSTTANNTIHLRTPQFSRQAGGEPVFTSGGFHEFCSTVKSANGFYHCAIGGRVYSFNDTTGEVRFLGIVQPNTSGQVPVVNCGIAGSTLWDGANTFYCVMPRNGDNKPVLYRITMTGNAADDVESLPGPGINFSNLSMTLTDMTGDLPALFKSAFPEYDDTAFPSCAHFGFQANRYVNIFCRMGNQDTYAWYFVYDLNNKLPLGAGGTGSVIASYNSWKAGTKGAWSVNHTTFNSQDSTRYAIISQAIGKNSYHGNGLYAVSYANQWHNGSAFQTGSLPASCTPTCRIKVTSTWDDINWGPPPAAWQDGSPISPVTPHYLQDFAVGDVFMFKAGAAQEWMRITAVTSATDITVQRAYNPDSPAQTWSGGTGISMVPHYGCTNLSDGVCASEIYWDFVTSPSGADTSILLAVHPGGGHSVTREHYTFGSPNLQGHVIPAGASSDQSLFPMTAANASFTFVMDVPLFAGKYAPHYGAAYEGHPGFQGPPLASEPIVVDSHPNIQAFLGMDTVTHVTGNLYKAVYNEVGSAAPGDGLSRKHLPTVVSGSRRVFNDTSGPGSLIGGALGDAWKFCVADVANECRAGSAVGEVFFNDPYLRPDSRFCTSNSLAEDDICIGDQSHKGSSVMAYQLPDTGNVAATANQRRNSFWPILSQFGMMSKGIPNTDNAKMLPGNWAYYPVRSQRPEHRWDAFLIRVRPPSYATTNRSTFTPHLVQLGSVPAGTNNVVVEFGYAEYGLPSDLRCAPRAESCVAAAGTVTEANPYRWLQVDAPYAGVACASGCAVVVPAISGRVLYYRVRYRDAANAVVTSGPLEVAAVR